MVSSEQPQPEAEPPSPPPPRANPPALNLPPVIAVTIAVLAAIHAVRALLDPQSDFWVILAFAFVPVRYGGEYGAADLPGGLAGDVWTWVTYAGLHGDITHLVINCIWLAAFGSAVARRFGWRRFLAFSALAAIGGAGAHLISRWGDLVPVVGASAAISGHMGAAIRFAFTGPMGLGGDGEALARQPALSLRQALRERRVVAFLVVWFAINLAFGLGAIAVPGMEGAGVAWEAHLGGFLVGLLAFRWFDPVRHLPWDPHRE